MTNQSPQTKESILITGASGLIGSNVCQLLESKYNLIGMDLKSPDDDRLPVTHIDTDLTDDAAVHESLKKVREVSNGRLASVIHLAAYYDFSGKPSPLYDELTVDGTRRLLNSLHQNDIHVEQFVFSSSLLVMKPNEDGQISELSPTQAEWAYPQSKLQAEDVIREEHGEMPFVFLRIAGVYDERGHSLPVTQQIARIYEKQMESFVFPGDSSHGQALVHLEDLAACVQKVVERRKLLADEEVFLIAEPDVMSYEELQERIGELIHGKEWPAIRIPQVVAKAGAYVKDRMAGDDDGPFIKPWMIELADAHYEVNIAHARTKLAWEPQHRLRDALPAMIAFLKQDPQKFYEVNQLPIPEGIASAS